VLLIAMFVAASFGVILGAPTLRLRGDYLAIVTLGFGEIVPRVFRNASSWTSGVNGISALDIPSLPLWLQGPWSGDAFAFVTDFKVISSLAYYVIMVILVIICVILVLLQQLPEYAVNFVSSIGLSGLVRSSGDYPGIAEFISRLKFLVFGLILVIVMLVRPQGLLPSRQREQELHKGVHDEPVIEDVTAETT